MTTKDTLQDAIDHSLRRLRKLRRSGKGVDSLPTEMQLVVRVHTAQGIIDNGGFQYFFESNFEDLVPYAVFCQAYRAIGAVAAAARLEKAVAMFPFPDAHLHADNRNARLEELWSDPSGDFANLDMASCGDETVWLCLTAFVERHKDIFRR